MEVMRCNTSQWNHRRSKVGRATHPSDGYVIENITDDPSSEVPPRKQERRLIQIKVDPLKGFVSGPLYEVKFV